MLLVALESKFSGQILGLYCLPISGSIETPLLVIREMVITLVCNNHSFHLCLMGVHWVESKTLGDQVAVAFNLFGNNDNYKEPETWETDNDRLRAVNYQLLECSGSWNASMATLRESFISCSHRMDS